MVQLITSYKNAREKLVLIDGRFYSKEAAREIAKKIIELIGLNTCEVKSVDTGCDDDKLSSEFADAVKATLKDAGELCMSCNGTGQEFPGNPHTEKCEECDGTGRIK